MVAERLEVPPALVSYHLRKLADFGLVAESEPQDTDRRKRWWKVQEGSLSFSPADFASDAQGRRAAKALQHVTVERHFRALQGFRDEATEWGEEWEAASFSSDRHLRLTPEQTRALHRDLDEVVARYAANTEGDASAAEVFVFMHGFPFTDS